MRTIAVMNQKGGVGKTTTAVNLCAALAEAGQRVGLIDLDPQAHASLHLGVEPDPEQLSIYNVLADKTPLSAVWRTVGERLQAIGSNLDLAAAEIELVSVIGRETILRDKLAAAPPDVGFLLIDCPPSLGILTINALAAVREVLIPLQPHFFALHGLSKLLETVELVAARVNRELRLSGVVLCLYDAATRLAVEVGDDVQQFFAGARQQGGPWSQTVVFETRIRRNIRLAEAPSHGKSIFQYAADSHGAEDYRRLAAEVLAMTPPDGAQSNRPGVAPGDVGE